MTITESRSISQVRYPLVVAIIYIHTLDLLPQPKYGPVEISCQYAYTFAYGFISFLIASAVPLFFLISGFLFFQKMEHWDWTHYLGKLRRRVHSLLIPYLLWNLFEILLILFPLFVFILHRGEPWQMIVDWYQSQGGLLHLFWDWHVFGANRADWFGFSAPMYMPINMPLWFLRDLIVVILFSPVLYWMARKSPKVSFVILFFCYVSKVWVHLPGFSPEATFYFYLGALFSLYDWDFVNHTRRLSGWLCWAWIAGVLFLMFGQYYLAEPLRDVVGRSCTLLGAVTMLALSSRCVELDKYLIPQTLLRSVFFIYVAHGTHLFVKYSPLTLMSRLWSCAMPLDSPICALVLLILIPIFTLVICVCLDTLLLKFYPRSRAILIGNR